MRDLWTDLLGCLQLRTRDGERPDAPDVLVFEGANQQLNYHRLFGGQLLGQFIRAAGLTCPDKTVKSLHVVFAREGRCCAFARPQITSTLDPARTFAYRTSRDRLRI